MPTIALQFGAGLTLAFGFQARVGALSPGLFCLVTAVLFRTSFANKNELLHDALSRGKALVSNA